ncbi:putative S-adenosyl-L-methionine-dependent methyltransferase [Tanacetum coccineum]
MGYWLSENATETYLKSMKMGNEPDVAEFISAIAAGNNAQLMVVVSAAAEKSTTLGLVAAAEQTGGHVISIFKRKEDLLSSKQALGSDASRVEFIVGDAQTLLLNSYRNADLVVIDCNLENHEQILGAIQGNGREKSTIVLGYNAHWKDSWRWSKTNSHLLPIGEGLLLMRISGKSENVSVGGKHTRVGSHGGSKKSHWIVKVDSCTGEEHVFRVRSPGRGVVKA